MMWNCQPTYGWRLRKGPFRARQRRRAERVSAAPPAPHPVTGSRH
jgi:hypothetical protein